jgi:rod shape-determining protein MreC
MKTRLVIIAILLLILTVLLSRNDERISNTLLSAINPLKQSYQSFTQDLEDKGLSYLNQQESIEKLNLENQVLRKRLLEQMHYIKQVKEIYEILPDLSHVPIASISIVDTISYVKLNSFSQIILTKPKKLSENKLYGIIQGRVVAGIARVQNNQLYGYLTSDKKCRFSVFVGESQAPGIALGYDKQQMIIKFIPKWHNIQVNDKVYTSGLDNIFFADVPVGVVTKVEVQSSYTVAYIKTYSDIFHPKTFFLINDAKNTLTENFDSNRTYLPNKTSQIASALDENNLSIATLEKNTTTVSISSIPSRIDQTQDELIEPETVEEYPLIKKRKKTPQKPKEKRSTLDLF